MIYFMLIGMGYLNHRKPAEKTMDNKCNYVIICVTCVNFHCRHINVHDFLVCFCKLRDEFTLSSAVIIRIPQMFYSIQSIPLKF